MSMASEDEATRAAEGVCRSEPMQGPDFDAMMHCTAEVALGMTVSAFRTTGLQATEMGRARALVQRILKARRAQHQQQPQEHQQGDSAAAKVLSSCPACQADKIFLAYTSNLISSGMRDTFAYLARHRLIDAIVTTAGGVEEDVIKCLGPTLVGDFHLDGKELRRRGVNRVGNVLVPNNNYCLFEDFFTPVLTELHARQRESGWRVQTAPSDYIAAMGAALHRRRARFATLLQTIQCMTKARRCGCERGAGDEVSCEGVTESECVAEMSRIESSVVYWCYEHNIPIYSPALTDGSIGDMIYFYNFGNKGLVVDPVRDVCALRALATSSSSSSPSSSSLLCASCATVSAGATERRSRLHALVLGGGLPKHHLLSHVAVDTAVMISTGLEADGCTSSCCLVDDRSCGLLRKEKQVEVVRVQGDAAFVFPLLLFDSNA